MQTTAKGERRKKTPEAARLEAALKRVLEALRKAPTESWSFSGRKLAPEQQEAAAKVVQEAATDALLLLDITFEDPVAALRLKKYLNRLKNFRKLTERLSKVRTWEELKAVDADEATKSKSMWNKYLEYADEIVNVVSYVEEEHAGTVFVDEWTIALMENERAAWDEDIVQKCVAIVRKADQIVSSGGFGKALGGRLYAYPREILKGLGVSASYYTQQDVVMLAADGEFHETVKTLVHELGHRVYFRMIGAVGRQRWREFFEENQGAPGISVDEIIRTWEAFAAKPMDPEGGLDASDDSRYGRYMPYFMRYLKKTDPDMLMWLRILERQLHIEKSYDVLVGRPKKNTIPGLDQLIAKKNDAKVFMHPVTAYSASHADELFAETFSHYLVDGPQRIPEIVRQAFRSATGNFLRVGSAEQVKPDAALQLQPDYGKEEDDEDTSPGSRVPKPKRGDGEGSQTPREGPTHKDLSVLKNGTSAQRVAARWEIA